MAPNQSNESSLPHAINDNNRTKEKNKSRNNPNINYLQRKTRTVGGRGSINIIREAANMAKKDQTADVGVVDDDFG